jgi:hypothetical protein
MSDDAHKGDIRRLAQDRLIPSSCFQNYLCNLKYSG